MQVKVYTLVLQFLKRDDFNAEVRPLRESIVFDMRSYPYRQRLSFVDQLRFFLRLRHP